MEEGTYNYIEHVEYEEIEAVRFNAANVWKMEDRTNVQSGVDYTVTGSGIPNDNTTAKLQLQEKVTNSAGKKVWKNVGQPEQVTVGANGKWTMTYTADTVPQGTVFLERQFIFTWGDGPTEKKEDYFKIVR